MNLFVRFLNEYSSLCQRRECHCNDTRGLTHKLMFDNNGLNKQKLNRIHVLVVICEFLQGNIFKKI